jgi:hypothetical protein
LVLVVLSAVMLLAWTALDRAVTVDRISRRVTEREGARRTAAAAIARHLLSWEGAGVLSMLPPERATLAHELSGGLQWHRTHPLVLLLTGDTAGTAIELLSIALPQWPLGWDVATGVVVGPDSLSWDQRVAAIRDQLRPWSPSDGGTSPEAPWVSVHLPAPIRPRLLRQNGMFIVDGPLELTGDWEVTGLVILLGAVRGQGGRLTVRGGLVGDSLQGAALPHGIQVEPDRPSVERALALVGRPTRAPFHLRPLAP